MSCGITFDISKIEMFFPMHVLVPAPKGTYDAEVRMDERTMSGGENLL